MPAEYAKIIPTSDPNTGRPPNNIAFSKFYEVVPTFMPNTTEIKIHQ
jgi:hypothetical protein